MVLSFAISLHTFSRTVAGSASVIFGQRPFLADGFSLLELCSQSFE